MAVSRLSAVMVGILSSFLLFTSGAFAQDESVLNAEIGRLNNESLYWGPYRPNLYFGVRQRAPNSLLTGLMWSNLDDYQKAQQSNLTPPSYSVRLLTEILCRPPIHM